MSKESWYAGKPKDVIRIKERDGWIVDYDKERGMYRVSYFEDCHFVDECWFDAYKDITATVDIPKCSVGDTVWYTYYRKSPEKCRVSMLQQKSDKSWKIRLTPEGGGVFDITLERFNNYCFYDYEEAEKNIVK